MKPKSPEFTAKELKYFQNTDFLKTKRLIINSFIRLFEDIQADIVRSIDKEDIQFPDALITKSGKITKGENYKELPFVVLDCPRFFSKNDIFAYRCIFWWGHYLSNHLLLKGHFLDWYHACFVDSWSLLKDEPVYLSLSDDPWNHDLSTSDFVPISRLNPKKFNEVLLRLDFLKLVWRIELDQWKAFHQFSLKNWLTFINIINR